MTRRWYEELYDYFPDYDDEPYVQNTEAEVDFIEDELGDDHSSPKRSVRILDIGCGTGRHALELVRRRYRVVGLDLSESMVRQGQGAARREGVTVDLVVGDARELPLGEAVDTALVLCEGGFSLMESDAMDRLIVEGAARALRPGGALIMTAPHAAFMFAHPPDGGGFDLVTCRETFEIESIDREGRTTTLQGTQRAYTCPELKGLLRRAGFDSVQFFAVTDAGFSRNAAITRDQFEVGVTARRR